MMVKDEADIIGATVAHLLGHVDEVIVMDNGSVDATREILGGIDDRRLLVYQDEEVGYYQSRKMTALADVARMRGHDWILPCDADEIWHVNEVDYSISDFLAVKAQNVGVVKASLYDHVASAEDHPSVLNPVARIGWRRREAGALAKVCARLRPGLVVEAGNHGAHFPVALAVSGGLSVRHFPYRSVEQFVSKVVNGVAAVRAADLPWETCQHWREYAALYERGGVEAIEEIFLTWFHSPMPRSDAALIFDPAPARS